MERIRDSKGFYQPATSQKWPEGNISVTTILPKGDLSNVPPHILIQAGLRGSAVHEATHHLDLHDNSEWDLSDFSLDIQEIIKPYMVAYNRFKTDKYPHYSEFETVVSSDQYGFAGRFDRMGKWQDQPAVFDIKTGMASATEGLQMSAYLLAYGEQHDIDVMDYLRISIHLSKDGNYKISRWNCGDDLREDMDLFISFLNTYRWKSKHNLQEKEKIRQSQTDISRTDISAISNPDIEKKLDRLESLKISKSDCETLDRELKSFFEGHTGQTRYGKWIIDSKEIERHYKPKPAQEARIAKSWSTKFTRGL
jgi:hypothetical protein